MAAVESKQTGDVGVNTLSLKEELAACDRKSPPITAEDEWPKPVISTPPATETTQITRPKKKRERKCAKQSKVVAIYLSKLRNFLFDRNCIEAF